MIAFLTTLIFLALFFAANEREGRSRRRANIARRERGEPGAVTCDRCGSVMLAERWVRHRAHCR